jgi:HEAT repeat protein
MQSFYLRLRLCLCLSLLSLGFYTRVAFAQDEAVTVPALLRQLASTDVAARVGAACALAERDDLGDKVAEVVAALGGVLPDAGATGPEACDAYRNWRGWERDGEAPKLTVGREAARALARFNNENVLDIAAIFSNAVRSPSGVARANGAWGLGAISHEPAVPELALLAKTDVVAAVRADAAWAMGAIGSGEGVEALLKTIGDDEPAVRRQAAWALGAIGDDRASRLLSDALKDRDAQTRGQTAWALGAIGHSDGVDGLAIAMNDTNAEVREQAAWALVQ